MPFFVATASALWGACQMSVSSAKTEPIAFASSPKSDRRLPPKLPPRLPRAAGVSLFWGKVSMCFAVSEKDEEDDLDDEEDSESLNPPF